MAEVEETNSPTHLPPLDPQRNVITHMDHCTVRAVCVNLEQIEKLMTPECVKEHAPLLRLHWQGRQNTGEKVSYVTISQVKEDGLSSEVTESDLVVQLLTDNEAIRETASKIYSTYNMWLTRVDYRPLVLTFQHSNGQCNVNLAAEKSIFFAIVRAFLTRNDTLKTKAKYQIRVHTGCMDSEDQSCCCFGLSDRNNNDQKEKIEKRSHFNNLMLPSQVEAKFQSLEEELSDHKMLISGQLDEQQKQYDDICTNLTMITECLNQKIEIKTQDTRLKHVSRTEAVQLKSSLMSKHSDSNADGTRHQEKLTRQGDQVEDSDSDPVTDHGNGRSHNEEQKEMSKQTNNINPLDIKTPYKQKCNDELEIHTTEGRNDFIPSQVYENSPMKTSAKKENELKSHEPRTCQSKLGTEELTSKSTTALDSRDTSYRTIHGPAPPNIVNHYDRSSDSGSGSIEHNKDHGQTAFGNRARALDVPCNVYNSPQITNQSFWHQDFTADSGSSNSQGLQSSMAQDSQYHPSAYDAFPDIQTDQLNFDMRQINLWLAAGKGRMSEGSKKEKLWASQSGQRKLRLMIDCMIDDSPCRQRLLSSAEEAMLEDCCPRVDQALDTVICLDTSGSMAGDHVQILKRITRDFIDGIEDMAQKYDIEENIALVTCGGRVKVIHHLSNDYESLREALDTLTPGGPSPLLEGLIVSMACLHKGGRYQMDLIKLPPRFVFISDGYPTGEMPETNQDSSWLSEQDKARISNAFHELVSRQLDDGLPSPVIFVPVGRTVCMPCFKHLAWHSGGQVISHELFPELSKYQRLQKLASDALKCVRNRGLGTSIYQSGFYDLVSQLGADVSDSDADQIYDILKKNMGKVTIDYGSQCSLDNIHEEPELPPLGSRVVRGPDWKWENQDTEGAGTIFNHSCEKLVWVCWDNDLVNVYRYGYNGKYDIVTVDDQPRQPVGCSADVGVQVQRGPDWHCVYGDQDGGLGHHGTVIRMDHTGKVMVRWQNGAIHDYRCGSYSKYDIVVCDPVTTPTQSAIQEEQDTPEAALVERSMIKDVVVKNKAYEWQRKDGVKGWEPYLDENNEKLKRAYLKNPLGSCLIQRNSQSFRVSFKTLKERSIDEGTLVPVRQHFREYDGEKTVTFSECSKEVTITSTKVKNKAEEEHANDQKTDVSSPTDSIHVGQDPDKGFDISLLEEDMKMLLHSVGIMPCDTEDSDTLQFIKNFVEKNGGIEDVRKQITGKTKANS